MTINSCATAKKLLLLLLLTVVVLLLLSIVLVLIEILFVCTLSYFRSFYDRTGRMLIVCAMLEEAINLYEQIRK